MKTVQELKTKRGDLLDQAQSILDSAIESGGLSVEADGQIEGIHNLVDRIDGEIRALGGDGSPMSKIRNAGTGASATLSDELPGDYRGRGPAFMDATTGQQIFAKTSQERFAKQDLRGELGSAIHNILRGDMQNAHVGSTDSAGGYILNPGLSEMVIDLARSASVCMRAGAITIPMTTSELAIAGISADATSYWRAESVAVNSSQLTFNRINLKARTLACIVPVSIEMLEDAANAPAIIEAALTAAMSQKLDAAGLYGSGAGAEPLGIKYASGTNSVTSVGTPTASASTYAKVLTGVKNILDANFPGQTSELSWVQNPRDMTNWQGLADSTYQPLAAPPMVAAMKQFSTTALPKTEGAGAESSSIIGDFRQLAFGMRTSGVVIRVLDAGTVSDGTDDFNAVSQLGKFIVAHLRADVALLRPAWFSVLSGITSA
ncbi:MAG: phage major capsid protein [Planctomycetales bacterium]|nr:phage major capsid protein [Planctomycetales bacterium]